MVSPPQTPRQQQATKLLQLFVDCLHLLADEVENDPNAANDDVDLAAIAAIECEMGMQEALDFVRNDGWHRQSLRMDRDAIRRQLAADRRAIRRLLQSHRILQERIAANAPKPRQRKAAHA